MRYYIILFSTWNWENFILISQPIISKKLNSNYCTQINTVKKVRVTIFILLSTWPTKNFQKTGKSWKFIPNWHFFSLIFNCTIRKTSIYFNYFLWKFANETKEIAKLHGVFVILLSNSFQLWVSSYDKTISSPTKTHAIIPTLTNTKKLFFTLWKL